MKKLKAKPKRFQQSSESSIHCELGGGFSRISHEGYVDWESESLMSWRGTHALRDVADAGVRLIDIMSGDKMTVDEWLGGVYGPKMIGLPQKIIDTLTEASQDDTLLDDKMIPSLGEELTAGKKLVWRSLFDHMATVDPDRRVSDLDIHKFMVWLQAVSTPAKMTPKKETLGMSPSAISDLAKQGASDLGDLAWFELSVFTGRPVSLADAVGFEYGAPPNLCEGAKTVRKAVMETFDTLMTRARLEGSVNALDQWLTRLSTTMLTCGHPFAPRAASVLMEWWMATRTTNASAQKIILYVTAYRKHYTGRGFPSVFDAQIHSTIMSASEEAEWSPAAR